MNQSIKSEINHTNVAFIVAMQKELDLLLPLIENLTSETVGQHIIYHGRMCGISVAAMKCGIGKVNAALGTRALIEALNPQLIINTGVAGGAGNGAGILDVVVGNRVAYHDVWCGPGTVPGEAAGCPLFFEADKVLLSLPALSERKGLLHGLICSGDIFVSKKEEVDHIRSLFPDVRAIDMESAAIAQTCYLSGVSFLSIRVVSDTPGEADNISQYETFWEDAPRHTFECIVALIKDWSENK